VQGRDRRRALARAEGDPLSGPGGDPPRNDDEPEADFGATLKYMAVIFGTIVALALLIGWLLTR
jgi:hypothetical protein